MSDTIDSCTIQLNNSFGNDDPEMDIDGEDVDDASTFTTSNNDITNRTRTTAQVTWTETDTGTGWVTSAELKTIAQEISDRPSFAGDGLVFILTGLSGINVFGMNSYDNDTALAPKCDIDYSVAAASSSRSRTAHSIARPACRGAAFSTTED